MGQKVSTCVCEEDCGPIRPWEADKEAVHAVSVFDKEDKENVAPTAVSKQALPGQAIKFPEVFYFQAVLTKLTGEESFGLAHVPVEDEGGYLLIVDFKNTGPVSRWNFSQDCQGMWSHQIKPGDRIVKVGSTTGIKAMRALLHKETVRMQMERWPDTIAMRMTKTEPSDQFGLHMNLIERNDGSQALLVSSVVDGIVKDWNHMVATSQRFFEIVVSGSQIICVDGIDGPADTLLSMLKERMDVEVVFQRPKPNAYQ